MQVFLMSPSIVYEREVPLLGEFTFYHVHNIGFTRAPTTFNSKDSGHNCLFLGIGSCVSNSPLVLQPDIIAYAMRQFFLRMPLKAVFSNWYVRNKTRIFCCVFVHKLNIIVLIYLGIVVKCFQSERSSDQSLQFLRPTHQNFNFISVSGRFGRIFCPFFMARIQFPHMSSALTASFSVRQPPNEPFVLSCPPAGPRLPCGCRRRCTGFPSASSWP